MTGLMEFFAMGGRGFYIWSAYGISFLLLLAIVLWARKTHSRVEQQVFGRARHERANASSRNARNKENSSS